MSCKTSTCLAGEAQNPKSSLGGLQIPNPGWGWVGEGASIPKSSLEGTPNPKSRFGVAQNPKSRFGSAPNPKSRGVSETQIQPWGRAPNLKSSLEGAPNPGLGGLKIPNPGESLNLKSCLGWGSNPKSRQGAGGLQILKAPWEEEEENKGMKNPSQPPNADSIPARGTCAASIPAKIAEKHQFQRNASSREMPVPGKSQFQGVWWFRICSFHLGRRQSLKLLPLLHIPKFWDPSLGWGGWNPQGWKIPDSSRPRMESQTGPGGFGVCCPHPCGKSSGRLQDEIPNLAIPGFPGNFRLPPFLP